MNKVKSLLDDKSISYGQILHHTGMAKGAISPYRTGKRDISKMSVENADKLQNLHDHLKGDDKMDVKIKGLKKAVSDFNNDPNAVRIYFDMEDMEVWTEVLTNLNETINFGTNTIVPLISGDNISGHRTTMIEVQELAEMALRGELR